MKKINSIYLEVHRIIFAETKMKDLFSIDVSLVIKDLKTCLCVLVIKYLINVNIIETLSFHKYQYFIIKFH